MIKVDQSILHDPENNQFGDCQRACIASLLEQPIAQIPHFLETGKDKDYHSSLGEYLASLGLSELVCHPFEFPQAMSRNGGTYHLIYGPTVRGNHNHAVVAWNGEMIHDPHPSRVGLDETKKEHWTYAFLVNSFTERSATMRRLRSRIRGGQTI